MERWQEKMVLEISLSSSGMQEERWREVREEDLVKGMPLLIYNGTDMKTSVDLGGKNKATETSLMAQRLRLCPSIAGDTGSISGRSIKIPHAAQ